VVNSTWWSASADREKKIWRKPIKNEKGYFPKAEITFFSKNSITLFLGQNQHRYCSNRYVKTIFS